MRKVIPIYGTIAGLIAGALLSFESIGLSGVGMGAWSTAIGYASMLIAFSAIFVGVRRYREQAGGGVVRFWPAFGLGVGISAVAGLFYVSVWEIAQAVTGTDFARDYAMAMITQARAAGAGGPALARKVAAAEQFRRDYANPLYRLPMTFMEIFPVGVFVSLVAAGLLRNSRFLAARRGRTSLPRHPGSSPG